MRERSESILRRREESANYSPFSLERTILENIDGISAALTETESEILFVLLLVQRPITAQLVHTFYRNFVIEFMKGIIRENELALKGKGLGINLSKYKPFREKWLREARKESYVPFGFLEESKQYGWHELDHYYLKLMEKEVITPPSIPSYPKIRSCLFSLKLLGLVLDREEEGRILWSLNPEFFHKWINRRAELLRELKAGKVELAEENEEQFVFYHIFKHRKLRKTTGLRFHLILERKKDEKSGIVDFVIRLLGIKRSPL